MFGVGVADEANRKCRLEHHLWKEVTIVRRAHFANDGDKFMKTEKKSKWYEWRACMTCAALERQKELYSCALKTHFLILVEYVHPYPYVLRK